ncbi:retrotransposon protein, putative, ty1-copia subclass [Tanacetum coccineum]
MASSSNRRGKANMTRPWTTTEEITLCTAWCNDAIVSKWKNSIRSKVVAFSVVYDGVQRMDEKGSFDLNMVPTNKVDKTPYEIWYGKDTLRKLWVTYFPPENKVIVARYGDFLERDLISQEFSGRDYDLEDDHIDILPSENTSEIPVEPDSLGPPSELIPVRRSERTTRAPNRLCLNIEVGDELVRDPGALLIIKGCHACPDKKTNMDGDVHTKKARRVAVGFTQTYGFDYEETFSPVADIRAIRILIAIAAYYDYEIWQMDVKTAFLNGRLDEDIYMVQPEGYVNLKYPNRVCKRQRSIYGLKQASCQWNKRFDEEIKKFGFTQNRDEPCVYRRASGNNVVFLILYVDDILIMGNNIPRLKEVKDYLGKCFSMKLHTFWESKSIEIDLSG